MNKVSLQFLIVFVSLLISGLTCHAQTDPCEQFYADQIENSEFIEEGETAFSNIYLQRIPDGCVLGKNDSSGISQIYKSLYKDKNIDRLTARIKQLRLVEMVVADFDTLEITQDVSETDTTTINDIISKQKTTIKNVTESLDDTLSTYDGPGVSSDFWKIANDGESASLGDFNLMTFVAEQCTSDFSTGKCKTAVLFAAKLLRSGATMQELVVYHMLPIIGQNNNFLTSTEKKWDQYFNEVSIQWPWELSVNSYFFSSKETIESLMKFPEPPNSKVVIIHPTVGFEYFDSPSLDNNNITPSILIDIMGYDWWSWDNGKARNRWGGSLVLSWANIQGMDDIGYGLTLRTPIQNFSIGVIWRNGEDGSDTGVFLNIDITKLVMNYNDQDLLDFMR